MRVLVLHNYYQLRGGEDAVFEAEVELLREGGHEVETYSVHNDAVSETGRAKAAVGTIWNKGSYRKIAEAVRQFRPEIAHFHNTVPLISPAGYYAARRNGAAVVQTLHNYRLSCVNSLFFRDGHVCQDCLGKFFAISGVRHRCYRGSMAGSAVLASMLSYHRMRGTWHHAVDRYIVLTEFGREQFVRHGLPAEKLAIKPNFPLVDPGMGVHDGGFALYVGRLSVEKGIDVLLKAWQMLEKPIPLRILGDGPLGDLVREAAAANSSIEWLGNRPKEDVLDHMRKAKFLVLPSVCYEGFPLTLTEAFAAGLPVVTSGHGAMASVTEDRVTGIHFTPGDANALSEAVGWADSHPAELALMATRCRAEFEAKYTRQANIRLLEGVYESALQSRNP